MGQQTSEPKRSKLTIRERKFVQMFQGNATEAAIKAGYKPTAARVIGCRLLAKPAIREAFERQMAQVAKKVGLDRSGGVTRLRQNPL